MTPASYGMGKGIGWGGIAATVAFVLQLPLLENAPVTGGALAVVPATMFILLFATVFVAIAALIVGVPIVALCERLGCAGADVLAVSGSVAGVAVILAIILAGGGEFVGDGCMFALAAMAGGGVMGGVWGHSRDLLTDAEEWDGAMCERPVSNRLNDRR